MATNPLGAVKLPAYVTDVKKREAALPPPPTPPPTAPPPEPTTSPMDTVTKFLRSTPEEQGPMLPPKVQAVGRGLTRGIGEVGTSLTEPRNLATLGAITAATAFAPPVVLGLLGAGFTIEGIHQLAQKVPAATEAFKAGNVEEGTRLLTTAVPDLAMALPGIHAAPAMAERAAGAVGKAFEGGGLLSPEAAGQEGFMSLELFDKTGRFLGRENFQGNERLPGDIGYAGKLPQGTKANVVVRSAPTGTPGTEAKNALGYLMFHGVNPENVRFASETGGARTEMPYSEFERSYINPPAPAITPPPQLPLKEEVQSRLRATRPELQAGSTLGLPRTPGGRISTKTRLSPESIGRKPLAAPEVPPEPLPGLAKPTPAAAPPATAPTQPASEGYAAKPVTLPEEAAPPPGSALERAIVAMMEHNRLLSEQLRMLTERVTGTPQPTPAAAAPEVAPKAPAAKAAAPATPTTPAAAAPTGDLATQIQQSIAEAPKVELTAAELKGMGATPGKKKGPVSYVGKTLEEKYAPKEAAAQPEAIKAAQTPRNQAELRDAIDAFNRGEGRPVNIVRRGLGGAKPTRGVILDNIKDMKGKPTEFYSYMPENWSGDPFPIRIREMEPNPMGKSYEMNVPRHAQRTYDLGMEVAVQRKPDIVKGQRVRLPDGSLGTHVDDVTGGPNAIKYFMKNLEEAAKGGDPTAQTRFELFKSKLATKGYPQLARVAMDDGRWIDFAPEELTQVGPEKVTTTQPSKQIKPETAKAQKEVEEKMTAAGPARAQKPIPPPPGPQEPGQPVQREVTKGEIQKEARVSKPTETYKGQRKQELAEEEMQRKRMEYKPGVVEPVKPTPPPSEAIPAKAVEAPSLSAQATRDKQLMEALPARINKLPGGSPKQEALKKQLADLKAKYAPKSSAKLTEPSPIKPYTQPATATKIPPPPSGVKATSTGGSTDSWTLTHLKGGSMEVRFTDDGVYVEQVRTPPEAQRQGVASEMYEQLGRMMKQRGIPGKNIEGNIQGPPDVVRKLRAKAAKIAGVGKPSSSRYDID